MSATFGGLVAPSGWTTRCWELRQVSSWEVHTRTMATGGLWGQYAPGVTHNPDVLINPAMCSSEPLWPRNTFVWGGPAGIW